MMVVKLEKRPNLNMKLVGTFEIVATCGLPIVIGGKCKLKSCLLVQEIFRVL